MVVNVKLSLSIGMEWQPVKWSLNWSRNLHVKVQSSSRHDILPLDDVWLWWCFRICLDKLALCAYVLLQNVHVSLCGGSTVERGGSSMERDGILVGSVLWLVWGAWLVDLSGHEGWLVGLREWRGSWSAWGIEGNCRLTEGRGDPRILPTGVLQW